MLLGININKKMTSPGAAAPTAEPGDVYQKKLPSGLNSLRPILDSKEEIHMLRILQ